MSQSADVLVLYSRMNGMELHVAMGDDGSANGELFWDDGESIGIS